MKNTGIIDRNGIEVTTEHTVIVYYHENGIMTNKIAYNNARIKWIAGGFVLLVENNENKIVEIPLSLFDAKNELEIIK